jgi:hypothetical protein
MLLFKLREILVTAFRTANEFTKKGRRHVKLPRHFADKIIA